MTNETTEDVTARIPTVRTAVLMFDVQAAATPRRRITMTRKILQLPTRLNNLIKQVLFLN